MQPQHAEILFNHYRREGHQFTTRVYNQLLLGWVEQVLLSLFLSTFQFLESCSQGNQLRVDILFSTMAEDGILPDSATYAVLLYNYVKYACYTKTHLFHAQYSRRANMTAIEVDHLIKEMESKVCSDIQP